MAGWTCLSISNFLSNSPIVPSGGRGREGCHSSLLTLSFICGRSLMLDMQVQNGKERMEGEIVDQAGGLPFTAITAPRHLSRPEWERSRATVPWAEGRRLLMWGGNLFLFFFVKILFFFFFFFFSFFFSFFSFLFFSFSSFFSSSSEWFLWFQEGTLEGGVVLPRKKKKRKKITVSLDGSLWTGSWSWIWGLIERFSRPNDRVGVDVQRPVVVGIGGVLLVVVGGVV